MKLKYAAHELNLVANWDILAQDFPLVANFDWLALKLPLGGLLFGQVGLEAPPLVVVLGILIWKPPSFGPFKQVGI